MFENSVFVCAFGRFFSWLKGYLLAVYDTFQKFGCFEKAATLTFTTLFAVVPILTVTYSMLSVIPSFKGIGEALRDYMLSQLLPSDSEQLRSYFAGFSQQARKLTGLGVFLLMVTSVMMLRTVDRVINEIWHVTCVRVGMVGVLFYWAILSLGPLLIGLGFVLTSYLASLKLVLDTTVYLGADRWLGAAPRVLGCAALTLLYGAVPNRRVFFRHALAGAVVVSLLLEGAKSVFAFLIKFAPAYRLIYGAFAAVPLFLLWVYLGWVLVLFGAILVRNYPQSMHLKVSDLPVTLSVFVVLHGFYRQFRTGCSLTLETLNRNGWGLSVADWEVCTSYLLGHAVIVRNSTGDLVLARDLRCYQFSAFFQKLPWPIPDSEELERVDTSGKPPWFAVLVDRLQVLNRSRSELLSGSLERLFTDSEENAE